MRSVPGWLVVIPLVLVSGCGGGGDGTGPDDNPPDPAVTGVGTPTGPLATTTIGAAGGTAQSNDGHLLITVPAGALVGDIPIGIQRVTDEAPGGVGAYRFTPDGTVFAQPVTIRIYYDTTMVEGSRAELLTVATQEADGTWGVLPDSNITLQLVDGAIDFRTTHFSDYTLLQGLQIRPPSDTVDPGGSVTLTVRNCVNYEERSGSNYSGYVVNCDDANEDLPPLPRWEVDVSSWAVNSQVGGNAVVGFVAGEGGQAEYVAPQNPPAQNPVAVSVKVKNGSGQEVTSLIANVRIRNTCGPSSSASRPIIRAECYPRLTGSSSTTVTDATPIYNLSAQVRWDYVPNLSTPGETVVYHASGEASFDAIDACISISPGSFNWTDGAQTAFGELRINLQDSTWTATGTALWTATYQDTCDENSTPGEAAAGGSWLNATGDLQPDLQFFGTVTNSGQTFTFNFGPDQ